MKFIERTILLFYLTLYLNDYGESIQLHYLLRPADTNRATNQDPRSGRSSNHRPESGFLKPLNGQSHHDYNPLNAGKQTISGSQDAGGHASSRPIKGSSFLSPVNPAIHKETVNERPPPENGDSHKGGSSFLKPSGVRPSSIGVPHSHHGTSSSLLQPVKQANGGASNPSGASQYGNLEPSFIEGNSIAEINNDGYVDRPSTNERPDSGHKYGILSRPTRGPHSVSTTNPSQYNFGIRPPTSFGASSGANKLPNGSFFSASPPASLSGTNSDSQQKPDSISSSSLLQSPSSSNPKTPKDKKNINKETRPTKITEKIKTRKRKVPKNYKQTSDPGNGGSALQKWKLALIGLILITFCTS